MLDRFCAEARGRRMTHYFRVHLSGGRTCRVCAYGCAGAGRVGGELGGGDHQAKQLGGDSKINKVP